jgi:electron transport complex protein RnfD
MAGAVYLMDPSHYANPVFHIVSGASLLCAFFIITDPVSGPTTPKGKLVFAAGVGVLTYLIRVYGGYPDGVAFSVLIMNMCVPLIDALTQPRVFGHEK